MTLRRSKLTQSDFAGWSFALPGLVLVAVFIILPFFVGIGLSLTNQRLISPNPPQFVGLANYRSLLGLAMLTIEPERDATGAVIRDEAGEIQYPRVRSFTRRNPDFPHLAGMRQWMSWSSGENRVVLLASDVVFMKALVNTIVFVAVIVPVQGGLALVLALLINQRLPAITFFRTIYFMPVVISVVVVSILWRLIYDGDNGLLNSLLGFVSLGAIPPVDWLGDPDTALGAIIGVSVWHSVGFHMVIWLAGLQTIPPSLYEAAAIEGASKWQTFRYVTWPGLCNTAVLVLIVITMQAFELFAKIDLMTKGGPLDSTQTIVFQAVERGFRTQDIATGSAISVIGFLLVLSISLTQRYLTRSRHE